MPKKSSYKKAYEQLIVEYDKLLSEYAELSFRYFENMSILADCCECLHLATNLLEDVDDCKVKIDKMLENIRSDS